MTTLVSFLTGWGLYVSLLACLAGCVLRARRLAADPATAGMFRLAFWRDRLYPAELARGVWPVRVLVNDCVFWLLAVFAVAVVFNPGHAVMLRKVLGLGWPSLPFAWADALAATAALGALGLLARHLLVEEVRAATGAGEWLVMLALFAPLATGLLVRSGVLGYGFWLAMHLVCGHVFLWCAPHCRFARLLR